MTRRRVAVVLFNLGGPDRPEAVKPFLYNLFRDPAIIALPTPFRQAVARLISSTREKTAQANYAIMGGASPLLAETRAQAQALQATLSDETTEARVVIAMRYWRPFTHDAVREVEAFAPDDVVLLPLYPQFSTTTTGSSLKVWRQAYRGQARIRTVCCWPVLNDLVGVQAQAIRTAWESAGRPPVRVLFSAHGLPQKVVDGGDPYQWQVERTCEAIAARLGEDWEWTVCYQSRVGPMKWLAPSTPEALAQTAADGRGAIVVPVAFVSEHVETLVELDHEYAALAKELALTPYLRTPTVSIAPAFIADLAAVVRRALTRDGGVESDGGGRICPQDLGRCPAQTAFRALEAT